MPHSHPQKSSEMNTAAEFMLAMRPVIHHAIALDPGIPEAHATLGSVYLFRRVVLAARRRSTRPPRAIQDRCACAGRVFTKAQIAAVTSANAM